jgi:autotransporter-associated beta strand protein
MAMAALHGTTSTKLLDLKININHENVTMKTKLLNHKILVIRKIVATCGLLALAAPLAAPAQQVVFNDTFVNGSTVGSNSVPGGTPTASFTSYDIATPKAVASLAGMGCVITNGQFNLAMIGTSSAVIEGQAIFTAYPVTLAIPGDTIDIQNVFTATTNYFSVSGFGGSASLALGLFNSGGFAPDTNMFNNGLTTATTETLGHAQNWLGYRSVLIYGAGTGSGTAATLSRPAQNQGNNLNQSLINNFANGVNLGQNAQIILPLTIGSQYTEDYSITLGTNGSLLMTNILYSGVGNGGTVLATNYAVASGANILTTNFDALCIGGNRTGNTSNPTTNFINQIIITFTSSNQAGPYFHLTTSGSGCGGAGIGLNGSVTTNFYMLYTNGVSTGNSLAGTGSALDFGFQGVQALYTIVASNTVSGRVGLMQGSQGIFIGVPTISSQPTNFTCVTNFTVPFTVVAAGNSLSYQWYKNGIALTNGGDVSGAKTANLVISPAQAADAAMTANGYYVVINDPCGNIVTSSPNASLTLVAPNNLVWQGGNPNNAWDLATTLNFTNSAGAFEMFTNGDIVRFDDTSANTSVVISNTLIATMVTVNGTQNYSFAGPGSITGFGGLIDNDSGQVTITGNESYTGGTVISNNATLNIGDQSAIGDHALVTGVININPSGVLIYNYSNTVNLANSLVGSGTVNYESAYSGTLTLPLSGGINSNFTGVANLVSGVRVHAQNGTSFPFGNGSTVNVQPLSQAWCDTATFNNTFNIAGTGWLGVAPAPPTGAISVFGSIFTGAINLTANARISGTITGGTILCPISGPYRLEIWGNWGSYVLSMGPTNGVHNYASTLITSGTVSALNTNAISTGPLTLDYNGDLRLNGNNLTVANLSSVDNGHGFSATNYPTIQNTSTTNATLTVGTDNTSTMFDGVFTNGGTGTLGLTKVGTGTLTLTRASTNTGTVAINAGTLAISGSGSFNKAAVIAPASGATYDVSAAGGTLTLNSGQYLEGNGTLTGILSAPAGSIVNPGLPMGTLTVSGSATVNGIYRSNLNRTNAPSNCSQLASSGGSVTYSGATLSVTNIGQKLQAGDVFQLFASGTSGFTTYALQTSDVAHNAVYTWNNTVSTDGKITVATVGYLVNPAPTNIVVNPTSTNMTLIWPQDHTGWLLQSQTNALNIGLGTNWVNVPSSATTNQVAIPIVKTNGSVYFRMVFTNTP